MKKQHNKRKNALFQTNKAVSCGAEGGLALILPVHQPRAQPGTPADHLPEFCLAHDLLEEHQIDAFRHINTCVHHIHGHSNMWLLFRLFEIIYDGLSITIVTNHALGK